MFIKRSQFVLIVILIMMMLLPDVPAAASASPYQQDVMIAYHPLTGMASFMGAPATGIPIREATAYTELKLSIFDKLHPSHVKS